MVDEQGEIRRLYAANVAALNAGDVSSLSEFYTEDAIQFPPDAPPIVGREAIRSSLESELKGIAVDAGVEVVEAVVAGDWAYARGHYRISVTSKVASHCMVTTGSWLDILKRQTDGMWKIARSAWSNHGIERVRT